MTAKPAAAPAPPVAFDPALLRDLFARQEAERKRVARALHDEIGQAVSAIKMSAHLARDEADAGQRGEDLDEVVRIADATVARLRDLYADLRPPQIDALGLEAALRGEAERWRQRLGVVARVDVAASQAGTDTELAAFRLLQDLLAPLAAASALAIRVHADDDALHLHVEHDGAPPDGPTRALLHARSASLGGELALDAAGNAGPVRLHARLPLRTPAER